MADFSATIKQKGNTDEWYTPRHAVELILPYAKGKGVDYYEQKIIQKLRNKQMSLFNKAF